MSTLLDEPVTRPSTSPTQRLRTTTTAVRLSFTWLGMRKTLTPEQKNQAADTFGAEGAFLSADKPGIYKFTSGNRKTRRKIPRDVSLN